MTTPSGVFDVLDLTQPSQVVEATQTVMAGLVNSALLAMFGIGPNSEGTPANALAVLLGVIAPGVGTGNTWPAALVPPLSANGLLNTIQNPLQALSGYYYSVVTSTATVAGQAPFFYMLREMATLLQSLTHITTPTVTGTGTPLDPWKAPVTDPGTLNAYVVAYIMAQPDGSTRLVMGIDLGLALTPGGVSVTLDLALELIGLTLASSSNGYTATPQILPGLGLSLALPNGYQSPAVAGTSITVTASGIQMGWSPYTGWSYSMEVGQPALVSGGKTYPVGQSMVYTQGQSLEDLVLQQAATFGQILTGLLGLAVTQANDRAGLAFSGILGLLPSMGPLMPAGLTWPSTMPTLTVTSFNDPFQILRTQLVGIFSTAANLKAALQLLSWASSNASSVPAIPGSGTLQDPFIVPLGLACGIGIAVWSDSGAGTAGIGLANVGVLNVSSTVQATSQIVVRLLNVTLSTGAPTVVAGVPGVSVICKMANPSGQLLPPTNGVSLDSIIAGVDASVSGTISAPVVTVTPTFLLFNLTLPGQDPVAMVDLSNPGALNAQQVQDAFNLALQIVLPTAVTMQPFGMAYDLLATMGLALQQGDGQALGVNPAGWRALLADPLSFTSQRLIALAADPNTHANLLSIVQQLTGVTLPTIPESVLTLLAAMQLITPKEEGYIVIPSAYVQLFSHPVQYLETRFSALLQDQLELAALLAALQQSTGIVTFGPFQFQVLSGPIIQISILPGTVKAGTMLSVSGSLRFALNAGAQNFLLSIELYNPQVGIGVLPTLSGDFAGNFNFTQFVTFGDGSTPAPDPLQIWPFNSTKFVNDLATVAPFYALSVLVSQVVDPQLLQKYTLVQALFSILGIASQDANGVWHTKSLLGLFDKPVDWLLSNAVLGANGKLNIAQLNKLLAQVPNVTSSQPTIQQVTNGIKLGSLPYNLEVTLTADPTANQVVITPAMTGTLSVAGGAASVSGLSFSLSLGPDFQPGFNGQVTMGITSPPLGVTTGYKDNGFLLAVNLGGASPATLQLVPFMGWQELVTQLIPQAVQKLLPTLTSSLLQALRDSGATTFANAMQTAGTNLDIQSLLNDLIAAGIDPGGLETAALKWLGLRLATANVSQTTAAVIALLQPVLGDSISASGGLISYVPSQSVPLTVQVGAQNNTVGIWAAVTMPSNIAVQIAVAPTGVAIPYDPSTGVPTGGAPQFSFGVSVGIPVKGETNMPLLTLGFNNGEFTAGLDPMGTASQQSDMYVELLPQFFSNPPDLGTAVEDWLLLVLQQAVPRYLSLIILNQATVKSWLDALLFGSQSTVTPGIVLVGAGLLTNTGGIYALQTFSALSQLTVPTFLAGLLKTMLSVKVQILNLAQLKVWVGPSSPGSGDFGITIAAQDLSLGVAPNFVFQLGGADSAWIKQAGGPDLNIGISVFVPIDTAPHFDKLKLQVVNVGVDFVGKNGAPLVNMSRFSVGAVKPRGVLAFDFALNTAPNIWGGEITVADIGVSLSPSSIGSGGNAVAQNLLGSGSSDGGGETKGNAANPPFSFQAGYLMTNGTGQSVIELLQGGQVAQQLWFPVQSSFGPVHVNMLGVKWISPQTAGIGFDGDVSLAGLTVAVQKLMVSFNVFAPTDYTQYQLDLAGLDVSFNNGPVAIAGAFFKQTDPVLQYTGSALLSCSSFSLNALGSYAVVPVNANDPGCQQQGGDCPTAASLFIFVNLNVPLGGPPAFFVMGLAAGFGYNRNVIIPPVGDISTFPFVAGAMNPDYFTSGDPAVVLKQISSIAPPEIGAYWVAAGLKFTSFQLLTTFALLFVKFGKQFELDLVGVTSASLPPKTPAPAILAYMELGILISFKPADGVIAVTAQLTPNSYLLAPPCKLTGGFAFILWFSGDFVLSLGGYNPMFQKPKQYPDVPRLGFNWPIDISPGSLKIAGGAYFALTPTAIMAGGYLQVAFTLGPIRAWLNAGADFLIQWKPFYYDISVEVSIGVAFHTSIAGISITLSASLGAALHLWGPETAGYAEVNWYVISFTIPIGNQTKDLDTQPIGTWDEFATNFLPPKQEIVQLSAAEAGVAPPPGAVLTLSATEGALSGPAGQGTNGVANAWALTMSSWQIQVATAVPATGVTVNTVAQGGGQPMGVRPMNISAATTPLNVSLSAWDTSTSNWDLITLSSTSLTVATLFNNAAMALWGKGAMSLSAPPIQPFVIANACVGLTITGADFIYKDPIGPIPLTEAFSYTAANPRNYPAQPQWTAPPANAQTNALQRLSDTIMEPDVVTMRDDVLAALQAGGFNVMRNPQLTVIATYADAIYQAPPYLAPVGVNTSPAPAPIQAEAAPAPMLAAAAAPEHAEYLELLGGVNRYDSGDVIPAHGAAVVAAEGPQLRLPVPRHTGRWIGQTSTGAPSAALNALRTAPPAMSAAGSPVEENIQVAPGSSLVLEMSISEGSQAIAEVTGKVPVRLWELNKYDEVIHSELVDPGRTIILDAGITHLAVRGEASESKPAEAVAGWQTNSMLTQVGRYSFLGDGCIVRPQATPMRRQGQLYSTHGAVDGFCILRGNLVSVNRKNLPGWLETMLDAKRIGTAGSVAVALRGITPEAAAKVGVGLAWTEHAWQPVYEKTVLPNHVISVAGGCVLIFAAPAVKKGAMPAWLGVLVEGNPDYDLEGVWGVAVAASKVSSLWPKLHASADAIAPNPDAQAWSTISVRINQELSAAAPAKGVTK